MLFEILKLLEKSVYNHGDPTAYLTLHSDGSGSLIAHDEEVFEFDTIYELKAKLERLPIK